MIDMRITQLVEYGISTGLLDRANRRYATNLLLDAMKLDEYNEVESEENPPLELILADLIVDAKRRGVIKEGQTNADLFDTRLMNCITPPPSNVLSAFKKLYEKSPKEATDWYYKFSGDTDYIRRYRIERDKKWKHETEYGILDITINLSKPEKDPNEIAAAKKTPNSSYPKCLLCAENEGYAGRINHPARQNHRIIPVELENKEWFLQYSPYVYYNEHCIVFSGKHEPMSITKGTFIRLLEFVEKYPHYFVGSNADLPIVGGSILTHDHYQGGRYTFAMENAEQLKTYKFLNGVSASIIKWPMSVIRLRHKDIKTLAETAFKTHTLWRQYSDESCDIHAYTKDTPHNTTTPIARFKDGEFEVDLVLRNNRTSKEHLLGIFHPHENLHHIKKENIGLIEVMGLAVLPSRLKQELSAIEEGIKLGKDLKSNEKTVGHAKWVAEFLPKYDTLTDLKKIIEYEVGEVFKQVLEDSGVFKQTQKGRTAFEKFVEYCESKIN